MSSQQIDTRTRILEATVRMLEAQQGRGVRMGDIAKTAGISRQAIYLHFPSRADSLVMTSFQNSGRQLRPLGGYIYSSNDRTTASHVFLRGAEGLYRLSDGFKTYEKVPEGFLYAHWLSAVMLRPSGRGRFQTKKLIPTLESPNGNSPSTPCTSIIS